LTVAGFPNIIILLLTKQPLTLSLEPETKLTAEKPVAND
jgi:hypothetical protein